MTQAIHPPRAVGGVAVVGNSGLPADSGHGHGLGIKGKDIASATALRLGPDGSYFHVTGTATITSIFKRPAGDIVFLTFDGALTFTHNATSLILFEGVNRTTAAGDVSVLVSEGSGNWREVARNPTGSPYRDALLLNYNEATDLANPLTVSANTWTDLLGNQSFTVGNANHLIDVVLDCGILVNDDSIALGAVLGGAIRLVIDSAGTPANYVITGARHYAAILNSDALPLAGAIICIGTLSAAAHTVKVQVLANVALNTGSSGFFLRASTVPNFEFLRLTVIERGGY